MIQRLIVNGHTEYVEFTPSIEQDDSAQNRRVWALKNGKVNLSFVEEPLGQFSHFSYLTSNISLDTDSEEELKVRIYEIIDHYTEQQRVGVEPEITEGEQLIKYPYDPKKIIINNFNWSIDHLFKLMAKGVINLSPDFQRNFVWDYTRQSRLIESILLGIPVPAFYLAKNEKGGFHVVDGLQRLTTIKRFMNNEFPLKYLEYLKELNGFYYKTDENKKRKGIIDVDDYEFQLLGTQFNVNVIDAKTPIQVKFDVFRRVNTGGKPLNNQEIRNCMMEESQRKLIRELSQSGLFKKATGDSITQTRMDAQELVMRFVGFWYLRILKNDDTMTYQGDMQAFLDNLVDRLNNDGEKYHSLIQRDFYQAMENAIHLFGLYAFRKCLPQHLDPTAKKQLINKSLFTTWSVSLATLTPTKVKSVFPNETTFSEILAIYLDKGRDNKKSETVFSEDFAFDDDKDKIKKSELTYFNAVSYSTNDRIILDFAFECTENLIRQYLI